MIKRILVGLAGTAYTPMAIERAIAIARSQQAELTGVTVVAPWAEHAESAAPGVPRMTGERREPISDTAIAECVEQFEAECRRAEVPHRVQWEYGDPFTHLVDLSRYHDLMVFGLPSLFHYDFRGGDPEALLIRLVGAGVRPLIAVSRKCPPVSRVLIAYNGSMESAKAMKRFVQMRLWPDAELKIVTFHPVSKVADMLLEPAAEYCRAHGYEVCRESNHGDPKSLLLAAAGLWRADLIVMGNSSRSVLLRHVLGDTLLAAIRGTEIPLFLAQ